MTKLTKHVNNVATGEILIIELTDEEIEIRNAGIATDLAAQKTLETEVKTKATAKSALLDKLGITEDEAKLLLS
jgi:hypothetical protein